MRGSESLREQHEFHQNMLKSQALTNSASPGRSFGIGVLLRLQEGNYYIEQMVPGGPAHLSNKLAIGDCLVEVDGVPACNKTLQQVLELIRGPVSSRVRLTLFKRAGYADASYETVEIERGDVPRRNQSSAPTPRTAIVQIQPLVQVNSPQIQQALRDAQILATPRGGNSTNRASNVYGSLTSSRDVGIGDVGYENDSASSYYSSHPTERDYQYMQQQRQIQDQLLLQQRHMHDQMQEQQKIYQMQQRGFGSAQKEGWMLKSKRTGMLASLSLKNRYFRLEGRRLSYFQDGTDSSPINVLDLTTCTAMKKLADRVKGRHGLLLSFSWKDYYLWPPTPEDLLSWVTAISSARE